MFFRVILWKDGVSVVYRLPLIPCGHYQVRWTSGLWDWQEVQFRSRHSICLCYLSTSVTLGTIRPEDSRSERKSTSLQHGTAQRKSNKWLYKYWSKYDVKTYFYVPTSRTHLLTSIKKPWFCTINVTLPGPFNKLFAAWFFKTSSYNR